MGKRYFTQLTRLISVSPDGFAPSWYRGQDNSCRTYWVKVRTQLILVPLILSVLILTMPGLPARAQTQPASPLRSHVVYLAMLSSSTQLEAASCQLNDYENEIAQKMLSHPEQGREHLHCNPILASVARQRAVDMAKRGYFRHTTPEGYGPNYLVREAGYQLPDWYSSSKNSNNIESIAAGYATPSEAWTGWMESSYHRIHILGEEAFYAGQEEFGIGYAYVADSPYQHYWVIITAPKP